MGRAALIQLLGLRGGVGARAGNKESDKERDQRWLHKLAVPVLGRFRSIQVCPVPVRTLKAACYPSETLL